MKRAPSASTALTGPVRPWTVTRLALGWAHASAKVDCEACEVDWAEATAVAEENVQGRGGIRCCLPGRGGLCGAACVGAIWTLHLIEPVLSSSAATSSEEGC
eukprot:scaffold13832_cov63-Phaeocystis_antarctica.AAC.2